MCDLHAGHCSLTLEEMRDSRKELDVRVTPDSQILRADAPFRRYCGGFGKYETCTAHGAAPQVHEVPVICESILAGIFAHRRDGNAVRQRDTTNCKRIEYVRHGFPCEMAGIVRFAAISGTLQTSLKVIPLDAAECQTGAVIAIARRNQSVPK